MQLYLDSYGAFLRSRNGMFEVCTKHHEPHRMATDDVEVVFLTEGVSVTSDAMMLAVTSGIPMVLLNYLGQPVGQVWSGKFGSIPTIRRNQIVFGERPAGWKWVATNLCRKVSNQREVLSGLAERYPALLDGPGKKRLARVSSTLDGLSKNFGQWTAANPDYQVVATEFRAWEATASRHYFRFLSSIMPGEKWKFENRNFKPALDRFNCVLNYLYGMLYAQVELALVKVGVDPSLGIMHVDRYNRPTMVYDFIEPYRQWADQVAMDLAIEDAVPDDGFMLDDPFAMGNRTLINGKWKMENGKSGVEDEKLDMESSDTVGYWLGSAAKSVVIGRFLEFLNERVPFKKQMHRRLIVLDLEAQEFASFLMVNG